MIEKERLGRSIGTSHPRALLMPILLALGCSSSAVGDDAMRPCLEIPHVPSLPSSDQSHTERCRFRVNGIFHTNPITTPRQRPEVVSVGTDMTTLTLQESTPECRYWIASRLIEAQRMQSNACDIPSFHVPVQISFDETSTLPAADVDTSLAVTAATDLSPERYMVGPIDIVHLPGQPVNFTGVRRAHIQFLHTELPPVDVPFEYDLTSPSVTNLRIVPDTTGLTVMFDVGEEGVWSFRTYTRTDGSELYASSDRNRACTILASTVFDNPPDCPVGTFCNLDYSQGSCRPVDLGGRVTTPGTQTVHLALHEPNGTYNGTVMFVDTGGNYAPPSNAIPYTINH